MAMSKWGLERGRWTGDEKQEIKEEAEEREARERHRERAVPVESFMRCTCSAADWERHLGKGGDLALAAEAGCCPSSRD